MIPFGKFFTCATTLPFALLLAVTGRADDQPTAIAPTNHLELFNGKDLVGWTTCMRTNGDATKTWTVAEGVIHCSGQPSGYLRTLEAYRDFKLSVEWRFVKVAPKADNTGILVHVQQPDKVWPMCVQVQGKSTRQGDLFVMSGAECKEHLGKDANTAVPMSGESNEKPVGEWNTSETICSSNTVTAFINGKRMNEITECTISSGYLGFQSEGATVEIRRATLEPLGR